MLFVENYWRTFIILCLTGWCIMLLCKCLCFENKRWW